MRWRRRRAANRGRERGSDHGRARDDETFAARVSALSHVSVVLAPSTTVGPEPLLIPVTGHNVYLDLAAHGAVDAVLHGLRAEVVRRGPLKPDGVNLLPQPGPGISYSEDLAEARRRGLERYRPMEIPDAEVFLDETPPLVRAALDKHGEPVRPVFRLPLRVAAGTTVRIVLAPLTDERGLIDWRLTADVVCGSHRASPDWDLRVTAETTMRTFHPDGREPEATPVHVLAPHWKPECPPSGSVRP
ncbi:hypothetical protein ABZW18_14255 [Streptomyces sp. NPDC004647]|uniref:hypothetical protein n=1 Tax=Streptomyces sp. NPDC004647 TaxID=3154671 RepID=UPI0033B3FFBE